MCDRVPAKFRKLNYQEVEVSIHNPQNYYNQFFFSIKHVFCAQKKHLPLREKFLLRTQNMCFYRYSPLNRPYSLNPLCLKLISN